MAPPLALAVLLLTARGGPSGAGAAGAGAFLAARAQGAALDACGCKIGEEGWSTTIQACRPESETSPEEAEACGAGGAAAGAAAGLDACGCRVGEEGWSSTIQACRTSSETSEEEAAACAEAPNEDVDECGCRVGEGWSSTVRRCRRESETSPEEAEACLSAGNETSPCLCVFDIDRTLTGKQADTMRCPNNKVHASTRMWPVMYGFWDKAYGGGIATLSDLSVQGIDKTFCNKCYLGICSAGGGSGAGSKWNNYILDNIMRSEMQDKLTAQDPSVKTWSYGTNVRSPYVLYQGNKVKQVAVEGIRVWYRQYGIQIPPSGVYMFGDRTENMAPFAEYQLNSQEISCGSRDWQLYGGSGMVGYCGATVAEIQRVEGQHVCPQ